MWRMNGRGTVDEESRCSHSGGWKRNRKTPIEIEDYKEIWWDLEGSGEQLRVGG